MSYLVNEKPAFSQDDPTFNACLEELNTYGTKLCYCKGPSHCDDQTCDLVIRYRQLFNYIPQRQSFSEKL